MRLFKKNRDIIIVTGRNAVGKTTASNYLRKLATSHNIPYESKIIADSQCLFEEMEKDDRTHGLHHTHDWCKAEEQEHIHDEDKPIFPFIVTDNELPNRMRKRFFKKLTKLPYTNKFWFVEWAGGVNTSTNKSIDYSYSQVKYMLEKEKLPNKWLKRVQAVVHVTAENEIRFALNKQRSVPFSACPEAIENGTAFWQKNERVLEFYGEDDFCEIEDLLKDAGINISMIENNGNSCFFETLDKIAPKIFLSDRIAVEKSPIISSASVDIIEPQLPIAEIWTAIQGISMLPFGASTNNMKTDTLSASTGISYLEEQE
jgi:hypothetical protein